MNELIEKAKQIKCLICDLDGVLTDGILYMGDEGEMKGFHVQDGLGLKLLLTAGIEVAIITGSINPFIDNRMQQLGIKHYFKGQIDKRKVYEALKNKLGLEDEHFAYIGDDLPDLPLIQRVGLGVAVANAVRQVKEYADWQTEKSGGRGAVRELCDLILESQGISETALAEYLNQ